MTCLVSLPSYLYCSCKLKQKINLLNIFFTESNSLFLGDRVLPEGTYELVGQKELKYVVSLGVFKDGIYIHICMAVMIANLNGITAGKCGHHK